MEQSPLSQDARPDKFKAKVVQSYEHLFGVSYASCSTVCTGLIEARTESATYQKDSGASSSS